MGKHVLFLVHGMGKYEDGWEKSVIEKLESSYKSLGLEKRAGPLASWVDFVPVTYDHVFEDIRKEWREQNESLEAQMKLLPGFDSSFISEIVEFTDFGLNDNFINTHILDVIMYHFFDDTIAPDVEHSVMKQITDKIKPDGSTSWSIMSHSLGNAATTNSLYRLFTPGRNAAGNTVQPLFAETHRPRNLFMLANVSKVLERGTGVYNGPVRPGGVNGNNVLCGDYVSVRNMFDPFLMPAPFERGQEWVWNGPYGRKKDYHPIFVKHVKQLNVHSWEHYLDNPAVQIPIFEGLLGNSQLFSDDATALAIEKYNARPSVDDLDNILDELDEFLPDSADNLIDQLKMFAKYLGILKKNNVLDMIGL
jgi:hypothetical protein